MTENTRQHDTRRRMGALVQRLRFEAMRRPLAAAGVLLALWGAMNTAMSVIWMTWMAQNADDAPEAAGSLMVAAIQASILLGAVVGGWLLDGISIQATFIGSAILAGAAVILVGNGQKLLKPR